MVLHHHEFYDGSGYPHALNGEQIPFGARIIAIADAFDTITSDRTYKKARTADDAFTELERCSANQFDPHLLRVFIETMRQQARPIVEIRRARGRPDQRARLAIPEFHQPNHRAFLGFNFD